MQSLINGVALSKGKLRKVTFQTLSGISMSASNQAQTEVQIPARGDVLGFILELTQSTTGTLSSANTLASAIAEISIKDKNGISIWDKVRGVDIVQLSRQLNKGQSRTVPTTSGSSQSHYWFVPNNIELEKMPARLQVTFAPYSDMASSGATGGTVSLTLSAVYKDESLAKYTRRVQRFTEALSTGNLSLQSRLPQGRVCEHILLSVGTQSNITSITFSSDGRQELDTLTPAQIQALGDEYYIDGHVSGQLSLFNHPFVVNSNTIFDVVGAGSDTLQVLLVLADGQQ